MLGQWLSLIQLSSRVLDLSSKKAKATTDNLTIPMIQGQSRSLIQLRKILLLVTTTVRKTSIKRYQILTRWIRIVNLHHKLPVVAKMLNPLSMVVVLQSKQHLWLRKTFWFNHHKSRKKLISRQMKPILIYQLHQMKNHKLPVFLSSKIPFFGSQVYLLWDKIRNPTCRNHWWHQKNYKS